MNEVSKTQTVSRLNKAIESEGLKVVEAAACIGVRDTYISMMRNVKSWGQCPLSAWEAALSWVNSGQTLKEYSEKHGKVLPTVKPKIELAPKVIAVKQPELNEPLIKVRPEALEKRQKALAERKARPSKGQMVDMLLEEKELLKAKLEAIDVLLKHYIS